MTWEAELIAAIAMCFAILSKWKIGNLDKSGWVFNLAAIALWLAFAVYIGCYSCFLNNIIFAALAVRGWYLWTNAPVVK